jgi:hypothetical protein
MAAGHYSVEVAKTKEALFISAVRLENPAENYLIELEKAKAAVILKEFHEDAKLIVSNLQILNRRLVLLNPQITKKPKKRRLFRKKPSQTARGKKSEKLLVADEQPKRLDEEEIKEEDESPEAKKSKNDFTEEAKQEESEHKPSEKSSEEKQRVKTASS